MKEAREGNGQELSIVVMKGYEYEYEEVNG